MKNIIHTFFRGLPQRPIFCSLITANRAIKAAQQNHPSTKTFIRRATKAMPGNPVHCGWGIYAVILRGMRCFVIPSGNFPVGTDPWRM